MSVFVNEQRKREQNLRMDLAESYKGRRKDILHDSRNLVGGCHGLGAVSPEIRHGIVSGACRSVKENHAVAIAQSQHVIFPGD